jgi:hypothetical protein
MYFMDILCSGNSGCLGQVALKKQREIREKNAGIVNIQELA